MSDRYVQFANFRFGLDSRRSVLTEQPGTMATITNAHVNAGAEIEQRKAFVINASLFDTTHTFGLEVYSGGLATFGSVVAGSVTSLPTGVTYLRCTHPTTYKLAGGTASMTAAVSCNFNGNVFVIGTFDDGNKYAYYGNVSPLTLVGQVGRDGKILYMAAGVESLTDLGTDLAALLNAISGLTATANVDENGNVFNGDVTVTTPPGSHMALVSTVKSGNTGTLTATLKSQNQSGTVNQSSQVSIYLTGGGSGSITLTAPDTIPHGPNGVLATITNGAVNFDSSLAQTALDVVTAVNSTTATWGYTARINPSNNLGIIINAPTVWGAQSNGFNLTATLVTITVSTTALPVQVIIVPNPATATGLAPEKAVLNASVGGSTGVLTYNWFVSSIVPPPGETIDPSFVKFVNGQGTSQVTLQCPHSLAGTVQVTVGCTVSDSGTGQSPTGYGVANFP
jgi:hypothetical protein